MELGAENEALAQDARAACDESVAALRALGHSPEMLAEFVRPRRVFLITRAASMVKLGEVWRLGTLLLDTDARLYAIGKATRAAERGRPNHQSVSREDRRSIAAAALHGGFTVGTPVNFDADELLLTADSLATLGTDAPIGIADGAVRVRWRAGASLAGAPTLRAYLQERMALLADPPQ